MICPLSSIFKKNFSYLLIEEQISLEFYAIDSWLFGRHQIYSTKDSYLIGINGPIIKQRKLGLIILLRVNSKHLILSLDFTDVSYPEQMAW